MLFENRMFPIMGILLGSIVSVVSKLFDCDGIVHAGDVELMRERYGGGAQPVFSNTESWRVEG